MVGVNSTRTWFLESVIWEDDTTASCSSVSGCSGSVIERSRSAEMRKWGDASEKRGERARWAEVRGRGGDE